MTEGHPVAALLERWRGEVVALTERYAQPDLAHLTKCHIQDLQHALQESIDEVLTLREAANACQFTENHLRRLIRDGKLQNVGGHNKPRVRRGDLPTKPQLRVVENSITVGLTRRQIARAVVNRN